MTLRRSLTRRIAAASTALLAIAAVATTGAAPVEFTEASWNDDVYAKTSLKADQHAGINYAQAVSSNGTLDFLLATSGVGIIGGDVVGVDNRIDPNDRDGGTKRPIVRDGFLGLIYFKSEANACARVGEPDLPCPASSPASLAAPAFSSAQFYSLDVKTSSAGRNIATYSNQTQPIVLTTTCNSGNDGDAKISTSGAKFRLRHPTLPSGYDELVPVPTAPGVPISRSVSSISITYTLTLEYKRNIRKNYALSELHLTLGAVTGLGTWDLDLILARAECGLSQAVGGGVVDEEDTATGNQARLLTEAEMGEAAHTELVDEEALVDEAEDSPTFENTPDATDATSTAPGSATPTANSTPSRQTVTSTLAPSFTSPPTTRSPSRVTTTRIASPSTTTGGATTSATPSTVVTAPQPPGRLSPLADTMRVGTVDVEGTDTDAVAVGDTAPTGARAATRALDTWINEGTRPVGDWKTFTASDPDAVGWRWAAINQKTGDVVYVV